MATWAATDGSEAGREAFAKWSAKSSKNDPVATEARWQHYRTSPPDRIGFGTLVYLARQHSPGWTYESAKDDTAEFAVEPVEPVDLWAKFDPPTLPRGVAARGDRGVRVRPRHDDGLRHVRHRGRRTGGLCCGNPG